MPIECAAVPSLDADPPEFCHHEIRKARKQHKCYECRRKIEPGERYEHVSGKWDGGLASMSVCLDCVSIRKAFFLDGFTYGGIWEDFIGYLQETIGCGNDAYFPWSKLSELTPLARAKVCQEIEDMWKEPDKPASCCSCEYDK